MHLRAPFEVAGVDERLAEPRRAAEVDRQHRIAAVGEQLVHPVEAITVARPRAAVDEENHGNRRGRPVTLAARRQGQVADQRQPVARGDFERVHRLQRRACQFRPGDVEFLERAGDTVIEQRPRRAGQRIMPDEPFVVSFAARLHPELAIEPLAQEGERLADSRFERGPLALEVIDRIGLDLAGDRMAQRAADVGPGILGDKGSRPRRGVFGEQRGGVAAAAVGPVKRCAVGGVAGRAGGHRILERGALARGLGDLAACDLEQVAAAGIVLANGHAQRQGVVGEEGDVGIVLQDHLQLAGLEVQQEDVVVLRIAVVEPDEELVADQVRAADDPRASVLERGQRALGAAREIDLVEQEVFVTRLVLDVDHAGGIAREREERDRAILGAGQAARLVRLVERRDEHVHHPFVRRHPAEPLAVGTDGAAAADWIAEQRLARDQGDGLDGLGGGGHGDSCNCVMRAIRSGMSSAQAGFRAPRCCSNARSAA